MQRILHCIILLFLGFCTVAQNFNQDISDYTLRVDSVPFQLVNYEGFGPKPSGSPALDLTRDWLLKKYQQYGYAPQIDTFIYQGKKAYNIIVEKHGEDSNQWIIIGAHYDSVDESPGANDNGSGVVATLQIARIIRDLNPRVGVRVINFGAEELGYIGSSHYVNNTLKSTDSIQLMINLDQLGGTLGKDNSKIVCERDEFQNPSSNNELSALKTDTLATILTLYTDLMPVLSAAYASDYIPFESKGIVITGLYQESDYKDHYHQSSDRVSNMDVNATEEVIRGAVAATMYFSRVPTTAGINNRVYSKPIITPNPAQDNVIFPTINYPFQVQIFSNLGYLLMDKEMNVSDRLDVAFLPNGIYSVRISDLRNIQTSYSTLIIAR
jgi:aminopeptidase YwaD